MADSPIKLTLPIYTRFNGVEHELGTFEIPIECVTKGD